MRFIRTVEENMYKNSKGIKACRYNFIEEKMNWQTVLFSSFLRKKTSNDTYNMILSLLLNEYMTSFCWMIAKIYLNIFLLIYNLIILPWITVLHLHAKEKIAKSDTTLWQWLDTINYAQNISLLISGWVQMNISCRKVFYETINFRNHQLLSIVGWWLVFVWQIVRKNVANYSLSCWPVNGPTLWPNSLSLIAKLNLIW